MKRKDGLVICDYDKRQQGDLWHGIVVNDGMTILPGMIYIENGNVYECYSSDPHGLIVDQNGNPRVQTTQIGKYKDPDITAEFCNKVCFAEWAINQLKLEERKQTTQHIKT